MLCSRVLFIVNIEKNLHLFSLLIFSLFIIDLAIDFIYPNLFVHYFGASVSKSWNFLIYTCYTLWATFILIVIVSFVYASIKEKAYNKKHNATLNDELEYVLTDHQKQLLLEKEIIEVSLMFNSRETGIFSIKEDNPIINFHVKSNDAVPTEKELQDYFKKFLNVNITVMPGQSENHSRWYRTIHLN